MRLAESTAGAKARVGVVFEAVLLLPFLDGADIVLTIRVLSLYISAAAEFGLSLMVEPESLTGAKLCSELFASFKTGLDKPKFSEIGSLFKLCTVPPPLRLFRP